MDKEISKLLLNVEIEKTKEELKKERVVCNSIHILSSLGGVSLGVATAATCMIFTSMNAAPIALSVGAAVGGCVGSLLGCLGISTETKQELKSDLVLLKELKSTLEISQNNIFENVEETDFTETLGKYGHSKYHSLSKKK